VKIEARHQNIKEEEFSVEWFKGFDLVMNALDNLGMDSYYVPYLVILLLLLILINLLLE